MAVLPTIPGLHFEVVVGDGPTSKEFEPPLGSDLNKNEHVGTSDGPIVHRFIESNSGSPFKVLVIPEPGFEFDTRYDAMAFRLSIDGMSYRSSGFLWRKSEQETNPSYVSAAITDRQPLEGPFVNLSFSEISRGKSRCPLPFRDTNQNVVEGAEDDAVQTDLKRLSSVGCIKIEVEYCWKGPETQEGPGHEGQPGKVIQGIAEKALVQDGGCHTHVTRYVFYLLMLYTADFSQRPI